MSELDGLATRFEASRLRLRAVAYRMLGSASEAVVARQGLAFSRRAQSARLALVNGAVGVILAPRGRLSIALSLTIVDGKITEMDVVADPERLARLDLAVLTD